MTKITINGITLDHESIEPEPQQQQGKRSRASVQSAAAPSDDHMLVHTRTPLARAQREALLGLGVQLLESVAAQTFLVSCNAESRERVAGLDFIDWTAPYSKQFKVHANLLEEPPSDAPRSRARSL